MFDSTIDAYLFKRQRGWYGRMAWVVRAGVGGTKLWGWKWPVMAWAARKLACGTNAVPGDYDEVSHDIFHSCEALPKMAISYFGGSQVFR